MITRHLEHIICDALLNSKMVVILGAPNTGKTSLINNIVKQIPNQQSKFSQIKNIKKMSKTQLENINYASNQNTLFFGDDMHTDRDVLGLHDNLDISAGHSSFLFSMLPNIDSIIFLSKYQQNGSIYCLNLVSPSRSEIKNIHNFIIYDSNLTLMERKQEALSINEKLHDIICGESVVFSKKNKIQQYYFKFMHKLLSKINSFFYKITNKKRFFLYLKELARYANKLINFRKIAKLVSCDERVIKKWTATLTEINIIFPISHYFDNQIKRIVKKHKFIFFNSGFLCYLLDCTSSETLQKNEHYSQIIENYSISEIIKGYINSGANISHKFYYLLDNNHNKKVDLIIKKHDGKIIPIFVDLSNEFYNNNIKIPAILKKLNDWYNKPIILTLNDGCVEHENYFIFPIHWI